MEGRRQQQAGPKERHAVISARTEAGRGMGSGKGSDLTRLNGLNVSEVK